VDNKLATGLFLLLVVASTAVALPLLGVVRPPWDEAAPPAAAPAPLVEAKPAAPPEAPARAAAPAPRKKTRIVWVGGGDDGACSSGGSSPGGKPAGTTAPRLQVNLGGSQIKIQPVGGYIATTAGRG